MLNICYLAHHEQRGRFALFYFAIIIRIKTDRHTLALALIQFNCWLLFFFVQPWDTLILKAPTCLDTGPKTGGLSCVLAVVVFISIS